MKQLIPCLVLCSTLVAQSNQAPEIHLLLSPSIQYLCEINAQEQILGLGIDFVDALIERDVEKLVSLFPDRGQITYGNFLAITKDELADVLNRWSEKPSLSDEGDEYSDYSIPYRLWDSENDNAYRLSQGELPKAKSIRDYLTESKQIYIEVLCNEASPRTEAYIRLAISNSTESPYRAASRPDWIPLSVRTIDGEWKLVSLF